MSGFPKLVPAFSVHIHVIPGNSIGTLTSGPSVVHLPFVPEAGYLKSELGYEVSFDGVFVHGADYVKVDQGGKYARLDVQSTLKSKTDGATLRYSYTGTGDMSGPAGKVFRGESDLHTIDFGHLYGSVHFEGGGPALQVLENKHFVQSGRFIVEEGKPLVVEYKISEVVA